MYVHVAEDFESVPRNIFLMVAAETFLHVRCTRGCSYEPLGWTLAPDHQQARLVGS
jgi:hypothetical protein